MLSTETSDPRPGLVRPFVERVAQSPDRVYWTCVAGIVVWAFLRAEGIDPAAPPVQLGPFLMVMALAAANLGLRNAMSRRRDRGGVRSETYRRLGWCFATGDFLALTAGLRVTGGFHSSIWVVSFLVVAGETVLERRREATITRVAACAALLLGTYPPPREVDGTAYALEMFVRMGLLIAVSSVQRRLRERSESAKAEVASLRADLALADQRGSLSREIHDGVGNSLAAAVLRLEMAARIREKADPTDESVGMLKDEAQALRQAMSAVRDWTFFTRPWPTDSAQTASSVLVQEVERLARRTGLPLSVEGAELLDSLPERTRFGLLRIAQEGLTNAAKHAAGATNARARLSREGRELVMTLTDDGPGFDTQATADGVGLCSMRERALALGGAFTLSSIPGAGTTVTVRFVG